MIDEKACVEAALVLPAVAGLPVNNTVARMRVPAASGCGVEITTASRTFQARISSAECAMATAREPGRSRSRADSRSGGAHSRRRSCLKGIFVEEPAQPGPPIELPPRSLRLGETIGDRVDCRGIYAEPDMTCLDLDVF